MLSEISRVLRSNGIFIEITYGSPEKRMPFLCKEEYNWNIKHVESIEKRVKYSKFTYLFVMVKN